MEYRLDRQGSLGRPHHRTPRPRQPPASPARSLARRSQMDRLTDGLAAASISDPADQSAAAAAAAGGPSADYLLSVMRAVEGADATIRSQLEENNRLKEELMRKTQQLQRIREGATSQSSSGVGQERNSVANKMAGSKSFDNISSMNPQSTSTHHQNGSFGSGEHLIQESIKQKYLDSSQANGAFKRSSGEQTAVDNGGLSQFSTPSSWSLSPNRHRKDGDYDTRLLPVSEMNPNLSWKQDLTVKVKEGEEEITQLRKHLADYSVKEAQIINEKCMLEKRIAYMRMAFDQQQQDLVDAASKALSYRQDIIEENIRLSYALQAAQQERTTFISSLLPLLSDYDSLQPSVLDAHSIVSNLKILFKHMQEQLIVTEEKLRESRYQITPWHTGLSNNTSPPVPTDLPARKALVTTSKSSLDIVPQTAYPHVQSPMSSPVQARGDWGAFVNKKSQIIASQVPTRNVEHDDMGGTSLSSRNQFQTDVPAQVSQGVSHAVQFDFETQSQNPPFKGLSRNDALDGSESSDAQNTQEPSTRWGPGDSPNLTSGLEDANPSYPYLPTVIEEPGSSFSEAAEDDPLPGIEGLRISGEAFPGRELQASGYPTNGTTTCNFEWVRYLEDGSVNFIEGARQPSYVVTADDVDTLLAIEVQPLDDRKRKGEFITGNQNLKVGLLNFNSTEYGSWTQLLPDSHVSIIRLEHAKDSITWQTLYPEWIDEEEETEIPSCPSLPEPNVRRGIHFDVIAVKLPCTRVAGWSRDVARLHLQLSAAKLAVASSKRNHNVHVLFVSECFPIPNLFPCKNLVRHEGNAWLYSPDSKALREKLRLPVGSCELAVPLKAKSRLFSVDRRREAYATILHSASEYVCGAITAAQSIRQAGSTRDLVILVDETISDHHRRGLEAAGWKVRIIQRIRNPKATRDAYNEWNYSKFRLWQLTDYDKIIFIDADLLILRNVDFLFTMPEISATGNNATLFNSGVMVIEPSNCTFELLMDHINEITSYNGGDQGYLNEIFTWWHRIPKHMNFLKHFWEGDSEEMKAKKTQLFGADPPILYILHYLGLKPWLCFKDYDCNWNNAGMREFASDVAHARWWKVHDKMPRKLQSYCLLRTRQKAGLEWDRRQAEKAKSEDGHWRRNITDPRLKTCSEKFCFWESMLLHWGENNNRTKSSPATVKTASLASS